MSFLELGYGHDADVAISGSNLDFSPRMSTCSEHGRGARQRSDPQKTLISRACAPWSCSCA